MSNTFISPRGDSKLNKYSSRASVARVALINLDRSGKAGPLRHNKHGCARDFAGTDEVQRSELLAMRERLRGTRASRRACLTFAVGDECTACALARMQNIILNPRYRNCASAMVDVLAAVGAFPRCDDARSAPLLEN